MTPMFQADGTAMEWPRYYYTYEPFKTPEEMSRVDPAYAPPGGPSSTTESTGPSSATSTNAEQPGPRGGGWRYGGCLTDHLEFFRESCITQGLFDPSVKHCLFDEERPSPLQPGYGEELFCCCVTCHRVLMGESTPEETGRWREARGTWRRKKEAGWKVMRKENERAAVTEIELEGLRARRVVAVALNLTKEEVHEWERKGEVRWREQARGEAFARDYTLGDGYEREADT